MCEKCGTRWSLVCSISEYSSIQVCQQCKTAENVCRNYVEDEVHSHYINGLHECKTIGHYADKQREKYGKEKSDKMLESYKTKKDPNSGMKELPTGMNRVRSDKDVSNLNSITKKDASRKRKKK